MLQRGCLIIRLNSFCRVVQLMGAHFSSVFEAGNYLCNNLRELNRLNKFPKYLLLLSLLKSRKWSGGALNRSFDTFYEVSAGSIQGFYGYLRVCRSFIPSLEGECLTKKDPLSPFVVRRAASLTWRCFGCFHAP